MTSQRLVFTRWGRPLNRSQRDDLHGRLLVGPTTLIILAFVVLPFLAVLVLAFADVRLVDIPRLSLDRLTLTLANFRSAWESDRFWSSLGTTLAYAACTTTGAIAIGVLVAMALRHPFPGRGLVRALVLIPYVLPVVAATTIWKTLLNTEYGLLNAVGRQLLGWEAPIAFLTTRSQEFAGVPVPVALLTVIAFEVWKTAPLAFLFITARLQVAPKELEEAAAIDGAGKVRAFFHIVLPQLRGVIALLVVLRFIWSFQNFNDIYLLTGGAGGTEVLAVRVYQELVTRADIGSASATGLLMTAMLLVLLVLYGWMIRRERA